MPSLFREQSLLGLCIKVITNLLQIDEDLGFKLCVRTQHVDGFPPGRTLPPRVFSSVDHGGRWIRRTVDTGLRVVFTYRRSLVHKPVTEKRLRRQVSARNTGLDGFIEGDVDGVAVGRYEGVYQQCQRWHHETLKSCHRLI